MGSFGSLLPDTKKFSNSNSIMKISCMVILSSWGIMQLTHLRSCCLIAIDISGSLEVKASNLLEGFLFMTTAEERGLILEGNRLCPTKSLQWVSPLASWQQQWCRNQEMMLASYKSHHHIMVSKTLPLKILSDAASVYEIWCALFASVSSRK